MTEAEAKVLIERFTAWDSAPALTADEVTALVGMSRADSAWTAATAVLSGTTVALADGSRFVALWSGTTGAVEPTWPASGEVADAGVRWRRVPSGAVFDVYGAAAVGWEWKAAKVAGAYDFGRGDQNWDRSQMYDHCMKQAAYYRSRSIGVAVDMGAGATRSGLGTITVRPPGGVYRIDEDGELTLVVDR